MIKIFGIIIITLLVVIGYLLRNSDEVKKALADCKDKLKNSRSREV
jgi:hypothetical protein